MEYQLKPSTRAAVQPPPDYQLDLISEFIGLCHGLLSDDKLKMEEAVFLRQWIASRPELRDSWILQPFARQLKGIFRESYTSRAGVAQLEEMAYTVTGRTRPVVAVETTVPFDDPAPAAITFTDQCFCLTGQFSSGRMKAVDALIERGGERQDTVTDATDYVVVGDLPDADWKFGAFGTKVKKAIELRTKHGRPCIISESHFLTLL